jgi:S2P endopeptidase
MCGPSAFLRACVQLYARQVRIYTAGAWHNALLAVACKAVSRFLPYLLSPFYLIPDGSAYVSSVAPASTLATHLAAGDGTSSTPPCPALPCPALV